MAAAKALQADCAMKNSVLRLYMRSEGQLWGATPVRRTQLLKALLEDDLDVNVVCRIAFTRNVSGVTQGAHTKEYQAVVTEVQQSKELTRGTFLTVALLH